jgi:hypothetical protein
MSDWSRIDLEANNEYDGAYETENDSRFESKCPSCGVILTTLERGFDWHCDLDEPLCEACGKE